MKTIDKKLEFKVLKKQERQNRLTKYCRIMDYYLEIGFFYKEARGYALDLLRLRR